MLAGEAKPIDCFDEALARGVAKEVAWYHYCPLLLRKDEGLPGSVLFVFVFVCGPFSISRVSLQNF